MRDNLLSHMNNPVDRFIRENPLPLMGPAGSLVSQGAKVAGTLAVQKVAPKLLAIGALSGTVNYMSKGGGGKDSSKDTGG